jgi:hypothetical protein
MESTNFTPTEMGSAGMESISAPSIVDGPEAPPAYQLPTTIDGPESPPPYGLPTMDLERGPSPDFDRQDPFLGFVMDTMRQQDSDANCVAYCIRLILSVIASLVVVILREIGYEEYPSILPLGEGFFSNLVV